MVVKIFSPHSMKRALNYNEKKEQGGQAECILADNYLLNAEQMKFRHKPNRLQYLIALNERSKKSNTLHISLNFSTSENLTKEKLSAIAKSYTGKIGFSKQPFLVYKHDYAGHPHIHIVTTNIQPEGKRIDTYNIGRNQSEKARKEIEQLFGLINSQAVKMQQLDEILTVNVRCVQYRKSETKRAITNVIDAVINRFKYTSLVEINAFLKQYKVVAYCGHENGRIYKSHGLLYKLLVEKGNKIGVPIKASQIYIKPTLPKLEKKFTENEGELQPDKQNFKTSIDWVLLKSPGGLHEFIKALQDEKIQTVLRQNPQGTIYGITFIDYRTKSVFNGSGLGKQYSVGALQQKIAGGPAMDKQQENQLTQVFDKVSRNKGLAIEKGGNIRERNRWK